MTDPDRNAPVFGHGPLAIAHRGGALLPENLGKENTLEAFANAVALGYTTLETDVRTTKDGEVFAFHDPDLRRVLGQAVQFADLTSDDVRELRMAGGARIVSLADLIAEFPDAIFNVDIKDDPGIGPTLAAIERRDAADRVVVASFSHKRLSRVRRSAPHVYTTASQSEVLRMRLGRGLNSGHRPLALQVPQRYLGFKVLTPALIRRAHDRGMHVHVWTIDDSQVMHGLLDQGVDGIITDRPDVLKDVLISRGEWAGATPD